MRKVIRCDMKGKNQMRKSLGFTLAEVLITLAIIGVVAAMTIPSVIVNTNQQEFKTGLKKAVSVLNQAITMNVALENITPADLTVEGKKVSDDQSLMNYVAKRLNIIKETTKLEFGGGNAAFYTADGMRFEFPTSAGSGMASAALTGTNCTNTNPCLVLVDVNGDKKPNPQTGTDSANYAVPAANGNRIMDVFSIMINENAAIPLGTVAQRTMFQND